MPTEVEEAGRRLAQARRAEDKAIAALAAVVRSASEQGVPDTVLARQAGLNRNTIKRLREGKQ